MPSTSDLHRRRAFQLLSIGPDPVESPHLRNGRPHSWAITDDSCGPGELRRQSTSNAQPLAMVPRGPHAGVPSEDCLVVCRPQPPVRNKLCAARRTLHMVKIDAPHLRRRNPLPTLRAHGIQGSQHSPEIDPLCAGLINCCNQAITLIENGPAGGNEYYGDLTSKTNTYP
jgi:hypothetical protein